MSLVECPSADVYSILHEFDSCILLIVYFAIGRKWSPYLYQTKELTLSWLRFWHGIEDEITTHEVNRLMKALKKDNFANVSTRLINCALRSETERDGASLWNTIGTIFQNACDPNVDNDPILCTELLENLHRKVSFTGIQDGKTQMNGQLVAGAELFLAYIVRHCDGFLRYCWPLPPLDSDGIQDEADTLSDPTDSEFSDAGLPEPLVGEPSWRPGYMALVFQLIRIFRSLLLTHSGFRDFLELCLRLFIHDFGFGAEGVPRVEEVKYAITLLQLDYAVQSSLETTRKTTLQNMRARDPFFIREMETLSQSPRLPRTSRNSLKVS